MKPAHWILAQINILILGTETCTITDGYFSDLIWSWKILLPEDG